MHATTAGKIGIGLMLLVFRPVLVLGQEPPLVNQRIVQFCEDHLGQQVGNGECFALANQALHQAGGTRRFPDSPNKGDYVWGALIFALEASGSEVKSSGKIEAVLPGDIIQFRDTVFRRKRRFVAFGHHTAVIHKVENDGQEWKVLQKNFGGKKVVTELTLQPGDLKKGWLRIYQPIAAARHDR